MATLTGFLYGFAFFVVKSNHSSQERYQGLVPLSGEGSLNNAIATNENYGTDGRVNSKSDS